MSEREKQNRPEQHQKRAGKENGKDCSTTVALDCPGAILCGGERDGRNRSCGALEEHAAPTTRPLCAHDVVAFQIPGHARGLPPPLSASRSLRPGYPSQVSHYPMSGWRDLCSSCMCPGILFRL